MKPSTSSNRSLDIYLRYICILDKALRQIEKAGNRHAQAKKSELNQHAGKHV